MRFMGTLSSNKKLKTDTKISNESYMHILKRYKKRKAIEPVSFPKSNNYKKLVIKFILEPPGNGYK